MSLPPKNLPPVPIPNAVSTFYKVAIVGAAGLKGKEVAEALDQRHFPVLDVKLLDDDESLGKLESIGDEMSFIQAVRADQFEVDFTFFASDMQTARTNWKSARDRGSDVIDLSAALEDQEGAVVRSPWVERQREQTVPMELQLGPVVVAHPVATVLALLALRAQTAGKVRRLVANITEPASEHGQKGMDELHEQTINLLSFQELPKKVYDAQVAFSMISRYGAGAAASIEEIEARMVRHYRKIAGDGAPPTSLKLVHAPVFHGYTLAVNLEMEQAVSLGDLTQALTGDHIAVASAPEDFPSNVNVAGQNEIQVSVTSDASHENAFWLWVAADNLRVAALNAVQCAETMAPLRPRGPAQ